MSDILYKPQESFTELKKNRFIVDFGVDELKFWRVKSVRVDDSHYRFGGKFEKFPKNMLYIQVRESEEFYHPEYFSNNEYKNKTIKISLLNATGVKIFDVVYSGVNFKEYYVDIFDYGENSPVITDLVFTFKNCKFHRYATTSKENGKDK